MKKILYKFIITLFFTSNLLANTNNEELYKKIDLFAEVLDKIKKEYVDKVDPVSYTHLTLPTIYSV